MILNMFFGFLSQVDEILWGYVGFIAIITSGIYFTIKSKFFQFKTLINFRSSISNALKCASGNERGVNPVLLYFASVGGMVGLGNIVAVSSAVIIGGPGALFWMWIASFIGMLIKYADIFLGMKYRVESVGGGYDGGPMYYLKKAFNSKFLPVTVCVFLGIYGVEIYQFVVITDTVVGITGYDRTMIVILLMIAIFYVAFGGVKRLAHFCSMIIPLFMVIYVGCCLWIIVQHADVLPSMLKSVWDSAFAGHAAVGGFAGSTMLMAAQNGVSRAVYSGDIGIGYDSIVQSESQVMNPSTQAKISVFALFNDTLICTMSCLVVLCSGIWATEIAMPHSEYIRVAFNRFIPNTDVFLAIVYFFTGFTTITGYLVVGSKCAKYLSPKFGKILYFIYATIAFAVFSCYDQTEVILIMSISGGMLMVINLLGIIKLRKEIDFS